MAWLILLEKNSNLESRNPKQIQKTNHKCPWFPNSVWEPHWRSSASLPTAANLRCYNLVFIVPNGVWEREKGRLRLPNPHSRVLPADGFLVSPLRIRVHSRTGGEVHQSQGAARAAAGVGVGAVHGAAVVIAQGELSGAKLADALAGILDDPDKMRAMGAASLSLRRMDAAEAIVRECYALIGDQHDANQSLGAAGV